MTDTIIAYLNSENPDFETGYALLSKVTKNKRLLFSLARSQRLSKVIYELSKFVQVKTAAPAEVVKPAIPEQPKRFTAESLKDAPKIIREIFDSATQLYKELRGAHESMRYAPSDDERKDLRQKTVDLYDLCKKHYLLLDSWAATGVVPTIKTPEDLSKIDEAAAALARDLGILKSTKNEKKREARIALIKECYLVLSSVGYEFELSTLDALRNIGLVA